VTPGRGRLLLELARAAIQEAFGGPPVVCPPQEAWLTEPTAVFVSLHRDGALRGCVGSLEARRPLFEEVTEKAQAAAFRDGRMEPVQASEVADLEIHLTLLHPLEPLQAATEAELVSQLQPGIDGLVLRSCEGGAVFIPAVWKELPDPQAFVAHLMRKARLRRWPEDLQAFRFTAEEVSADAPGA
jgi:hypothetical protein